MDDIARLEAELMATQAPRLQLALMRVATFNAFDGDRVVDDLLAHRELWQAALMKRDDLIPLRDLPLTWNVDTLYILARRNTVER